MDGTRFDTLTRELATRRRLLGALFGLAAGSSALAAADDAGAAGRTCRLGYVCTHYTTLDDGGLTDGYCAPGCRSASVGIDCVQALIAWVQRGAKAQPGIGRETSGGMPGIA